MNKKLLYISVLMLLSSHQLLAEEIKTPLDQKFQSLFEEKDFDLQKQKMIEIAAYIEANFEQILQMQQPVSFETIRNFFLYPTILDLEIYSQDSADYIPGRTITEQESFMMLEYVCALTIGHTHNQELREIYYQFLSSKPKVYDTDLQIFAQVEGVDLDKETSELMQLFGEESAYRDFGNIPEFKLLEHLYQEGKIDERIMDELLKRDIQRWTKEEVITIISEINKIEKEKGIMDALDYWKNYIEKKQKEEGLDILDCWGERKEEREIQEKYQVIQPRITKFIIENNLDQLIEFLSSDVNQDGDVTEEDVELLDMAVTLKEGREKLFFLFLNIDIPFLNPIAMISFIKRISSLVLSPKIKEALELYKDIEGLQKELAKKFLEKFIVDLDLLDINGDKTLNSVDIIFVGKEQQISEDIKKDGRGKVILIYRN